MSPRSRYRAIREFVWASMGWDAAFKAGDREALPLWNGRIDDARAKLPPRLQAALLPASGTP